MHHKRCIGPLPSIQLSSTWISLTRCAGTARVCSSALIAHSFLTRSPCALARVVTRGGIELYCSAQAFRHVVSVDTNNVLRFDRGTVAQGSFRRRSERSAPGTDLHDLHQRTLKTERVVEPMCSKNAHASAQRFLQSVIRLPRLLRAVLLVGGWITIGF